MSTELKCHACGTPATVQAVPKQSTPPKVAHSIRIEQQLDDRVAAKCQAMGITFTSACEKALEEWVAPRPQ